MTTEKFYRVKVDNFLWKKGAILSDGEKGQYQAIEDIWDNVAVIDHEYISARIIEHKDNEDYFERVYPDTVIGNLYRTKDELVEKYNAMFT